MTDQNSTAQPSTDVEYTGEGCPTEAQIARFVSPDVDISEAEGDAIDDHLDECEECEEIYTGMLPDPE